jgi:ribosome-associated protein
LEVFLSDRSLAPITDALHVSSFFYCHPRFFWYNAKLKIVLQEDMATDSKIKSLLCLKAAIEKKAQDPVLLELKGITFFTDYFLLCSGKSDRQVQAIAQAIEETLRKKGIRPLGEEGTREGKWILLDYEDVVVHVFLEAVRRFYDLEGLWIDAPRIDLQKGVIIEERTFRSEKRSG